LTTVPRTLFFSLAVVTVLLLVACSGGGGKKAAAGQGATTSTAQAGAGAGASTLGSTTASGGQDGTSRALSLKTFSSPSGNIGCVLESTSARCDVRQHIYTTGLKPDSCKLDWGDSLEVSNQGLVDWVCHGDTVVQPGAAVLPYGKSSRQGAITCDSADTGITCTQRPSGHGFLISRERYRIF
jgi:hypothetical protein